ncbi:MAG: methyltransferase, partial [Myxococcales bacterium]
AAPFFFAGDEVRFIDGRARLAAEPLALAHEAAWLRATGELGADETLDVTPGGELLLVQRRNGYRFTADALLLAEFAAAHGGEVLDVGTGCGVVGLLLLARKKSSRVVAVEVQPALAALARRNAELNGLTAHFEVVTADVRTEAFGGGRFAHIVANPPYFRVSEGRLSPDAERAVARHEVALTLEQLALSVAALLAPDGRLSVVLPSGRRDECQALLALRGLAVVREERVARRHLWLAEFARGPARGP